MKIRVASAVSSTTSNNRYSQPPISPLSQDGSTVRPRTAFKLPIDEASSSLPSSSSVNNNSSSLTARPYQSDGPAPLTARRRERIFVLLRQKFFRETLVNVLFLALFTAATLALVNTNLGSVTQAISSAIVIGGDKTFKEVRSATDWYTWMSNVFIPVVYKNNQSPIDPVSVFHRLILLGPVRIRQQRMNTVPLNSTQCLDILPPDLRGFLKSRAEATASSAQQYMTASSTCLLPDEQSQETMNAADGSGLSWTWAAPADVATSYYWGKFGTYSSSGFSQLLPITGNTTSPLNIVSSLQSANWIDYQTRVLFVELSAYSPSANAFSVVQLSVEFLPTGEVVPTSSVHTIELMQRDTFGNRIHLGLEIALIAFSLWFIGEEIFAIASNGCSIYMRSAWSYINWIIILCFLACIPLRLATMGAVKNVKFIADLNSTTYLDLSAPAFYQAQEINLRAFTSFLCWLRLFKVLSIFPRFSVLTRTLSNSLPDLSSFLPIFFVCFIGYSTSFFVAFGRDIGDYRSIGAAMSTLFQMALGDFDFNSLATANRVLGPLFFSLYVITIVWIMTSVFIAIISDHFINENRESRAKLLLGEPSVMQALSEFFAKKWIDLKRSLRLTDVQVENLREQIKQFDENLDFALDKKEFAALQSKGDGNHSAVLEHFDANNDGELDNAEYKALHSMLQSNSDNGKSDRIQQQQVDKGQQQQKEKVEDLTLPEPIAASPPPPVAQESSASSNREANNGSITAASESGPIVLSVAADSLPSSPVLPSSSILSAQPRSQSLTLASASAISQPRNLSFSVLSNSSSLLNRRMSSSISSSPAPVISPAPLQQQQHPQAPASPPPVSVSVLAVPTGPPAPAPADGLRSQLSRMPSLWKK